MVKETTTLDASAPEPRTPYFVYGSLMSSEILLSIIKGAGPKDTKNLTRKVLKANQMSRATLYGHKRYAVDGADFPAILNTGKPEDFVEGYLVSGLTKPQEASIERFESGLYTDRNVEVVMGWGEEAKAGEVKKARVYVWGGYKEELVDPEVQEWTFEKFKETGMYQFGREVDSDEEDGN